MACYAAPDNANIAPKHRDPNGTWVSIYGAIATVAWNTKMVKPNEAPKDWKDLLDPRWKGRKIGLPAEAFQWYGGMVSYLGLDGDTLAGTLDFYVKAMSRDGRVGESVVRELINEQRELLNVKNEISLNQVSDFGPLQRVIKELNLSK